MEAKKSLGQNFLRDREILKKIADFAQIENEDVVVEIGPGEGTLTEILLERAKKVIAVEKDERMIDFLKEKFKSQISNDKLEIISGDILDLSDDFFTKKYKLIGNIPYYITGALFKKFLEAENQPKSMTFVVQKEVADRIMARYYKESILSISIKAYGEPKYGGPIKAGSFYPKPKVDSAIISVRKISKERFRGENTKEKGFFEILRAGFAHKRKFLIKNLQEALKPGLDMLELKEIFKKCDIPEKARAEDLKVDDWICLTKNI